MKSGKMEVVEEKGSSSALAAAKKRDAVYKFDEARISKQEAEKPWDKEYVVAAVAGAKDGMVFQLAR